MKKVLSMAERLFRECEAAVVESSLQEKIDRVAVSLLVARTYRKAWVTDSFIGDPSVVLVIAIRILIPASHRQFQNQTCPGSVHLRKGSPPCRGRRFR